MASVASSKRRLLLLRGANSIPGNLISEAPRTATVTVSHYTSHLIPRRGKHCFTIALAPSHAHISMHFSSIYLRYHCLFFLRCPPSPSSLDYFAAFLSSFAQSFLSPVIFFSQWSVANYS